MTGPAKDSTNPWVRLDVFLARLRPHREPLTLLIDAGVVALCWNATYLFRLGFERWISARPAYDGAVLFANVPTTGFTPAPGDSFVWAARSGAVSQTFRIDADLVPVKTHNTA